MSKYLRTIQVINVRWLNATAWYGLELARLLNNAGHETAVLGLRNTDSFRAAQSMGLHPLAFDLNTKNPFQMAKMIIELGRFVREFQPDIVNCHRGEGFLFWAMLKKIYGFTLIRTRGDQRLPRNNIPNRLLHTHAADALIATNSRMATHFTEHFGIESSKVHTVFGGVDRTRFAFNTNKRNEIRAHLGFTETSCVIGLLGRFDRVKGQRELINAVARLVQEGRKQIQLVLLGFTTALTQDTVKQWIKDANMEQHVTVTGKVEDVSAYLSALDIGVIASLWSETIARAALEIMACERPLISTAVGVMPDLLPPEALCAPNDEKALATLLARAVDDTAWRKTLVDWNQTQMSRLDSRHFLEQTLCIYNKNYIK